MIPTQAQTRRADRRAAAGRNLQAHKTSYNTPFPLFFTTTTIVYARFGLHYAKTVQSYIPDLVYTTSKCNTKLRQHRESVVTSKMTANGIGHLPYVLFGGAGRGSSATSKTIDTTEKSDPGCKKNITTSCRKWEIISLAFSSLVLMYNDVFANYNSELQY